MLLFPAPRIAKSFIISNALSPSASPFSNSSEAQKLQSSSSSRVKYVVDSLGFSEEEAIFVSSSASSIYKVKTHSKSTAKADLVVNLLKSYGFDDSQIKEIVSSIARNLLRNDDILVPKIRFLLDLGLTGSDLAKAFKSNRQLIRMELEGEIIPRINFLKKLLGSDEKVINAIVHSRWLSSDNLEKMSANLLLLQNYGLSKEKIFTLLGGRRYLEKKPEWLQDKLDFVEVNLGIPRDSRMFFYGLWAVLPFSVPKIIKKIRVVKSFGWSDSEVYALLKAQPFVLTRSEADMRNKLNLFMEELNYMPDYLIQYAVILTLSWEKRIKPRYEIFKILKQKNLVSERPAFCTLLRHTENMFLRFVRKFENQVPNLRETYIISVENATKTT